MYFTPLLVARRGRRHLVGFLASALLALLLASTARAQVTYTWSGPSGGVWTTAANWTPARTAPAASDVLVFDGSVVTSPLITGITSQTVGRLVFVNGGTTGLQGLSGSPVTLTISGGSGVDLDVPAGSTVLGLGGTGRVTLALTAGATGLVAGGLDVSGQVTAAGAGSLVFTSGSVFTHHGIPGANPFGTTSLNSVVFQSGSTYVSSGGGNPFGAVAPASVVTFQSGSLYRHSNSGDLSLSGRTYADFELNAPGGFNQTATGSQTLTVDDFRVLAGSLSLQLTSVSIKGDLEESGGATLSFNPTSAQAISLNGTAPQLVQGSISFNSNTNLTVSNPAGVTWQVAAGVGPRNVTLNGGNLQLTGPAVPFQIDGQLNLTNGILTTGPLSIHLPSGATVTGGSSASYVNGNLRKTISISGGASQKKFEVGDATTYAPVTIAFPSVSVAGELTVSTSAGDHPEIGTAGVDAAQSVNRSWSVANNTAVFAPSSATFTFVPADLDAGADPANLEVRKFAPPSTWTAPATGTRTATTTQATGIASFDSPASAFVLAEPMVTFTITASAGAGGSISPAGATVLAAGSGQSYTITPDPGQGILDVLVDDVSQGAIASYSFTNVSANHTIAASFTPAGATATLAGVVNTGLGGAQLHVTAGGELVVSNIGSSGNDGVSFPASDPEEGNGIGFGSGIPIDPAVDEGGSVVVQMMGTAAGQTASLGTIRADVVADGIDITPDFADAGAADVHVEAFLGGQRVRSCRVPNGTALHRAAAAAASDARGAEPFATLAAGDGIQGVEVGLKKKPCGQLVSKVTFTGSKLVNVNGVLVLANQLQFTALAPKQPLVAATALLKVARPGAVNAQGRARTSTLSSNLSQVTISSEQIVLDSLGAAGGGIHVERLGGAAFVGGTMVDGATMTGIGSSGNDGIDLWLDSSTGATHTFGDGMGFSTATDAGAFLEHRVRGKVGCAPDSTVAIGTETVYPDSIALRADFSRMGATGVMITILDNGAIVHEANYGTGQSVRLVEPAAGPGFSAHAASINTTRSNIKDKASIAGGGLKLGWTYKRPGGGSGPYRSTATQAMPFDMMIGASRYQGDEARFSSIGGTPVPEITGAAMRQKNPGGAKLDTLRLGRPGISVGASAASNVAKGAAGLLAVNGKVVVHNIGSSGQDGVLVKADKPSPVLSLRMSGVGSAAELSGAAKIKFTTEGSRSAAAAAVPILAVGAEKAGSSLRMGPKPLGSVPADLSQSRAQAASYRLEVLLNEVVVASLDAAEPQVDFDRLPDQLFGTASGAAFQGRWDSPLQISVVGGSAQLANGLRIRPLGEPDDVISLSSMDIQASDLPSFEVGDWLSPVLGVPGTPSANRGAELRLGRNPIHPGGALEMSVSLSAPAWVDLDVFDAQGRRVAVVFRGMQAPGIATRSWAPAGDITSGLFFVRLRAAGRTQSEKVVFMQ